MAFEAFCRLSYIRRKAEINRLWLLCLHIVLPPIALLLLVSSAPGQGQLDTIREDVRPQPQPQPLYSAPPEEHRDDVKKKKDDGNVGASFLSSFLGEYISNSARNPLTSAFYVVGAGLTSPYWAPRSIFKDTYGVPVCFSLYPYDGSTGFLMSEAWDVSVEAIPDSSGNQTSAEPKVTFNTPEGWINRRPWAGQIRLEYGDQFARVTELSGRLILEHSCRWGIDVSAESLRERLSDDTFDYLAIGDANIVFRFAQHPKALMRIGLGVNWLHDSIRTDKGFNFTYGGDFFPVKPLIISSTIDWGTLGDAELFRFQFTAGLIVNRFETYVGYEYLDIDRTHANSLLAGMRVWF
jgi:hypothetical protein